MSVLVHAEVGGQMLDDQSLIFESLLILNGGDETTRHVISGGMYELMRHPEQFQRLREDPSQIPRAVEEMLRWVTPIVNMMRTCTRDVELRGHRLREGDRLLLLYPSANRDERVFEDPDRFDVARDPNPHVAFGGYGNHFCLGNALARLELRVLFEETLARLPDLALASEAPLPVRDANFVSGYESMPVRFTPAPPQVPGRPALPPASGPASRDSGRWRSSSARPGSGPPASPPSRRSPPAARRRSTRPASRAG
jgi:cytochrome P450 family 142 subfamily A polypeptide 1